MGGFNILKKYPELLELACMSETDRKADLLSIFKRDIEDNGNLSFRSRKIYPTKKDGEPDMGRLFKHLTCEAMKVEDEHGHFYEKRVFEINRSERLHWINHHVNEKTPANIEVFTVEERDKKKRKTKKTYIYDEGQKYVIVLEQQRNDAFYLLTAYHLNKDYGEKEIKKKRKKALSTPL